MTGNAFKTSESEYVMCFYIVQRNWIRHRENIRHIIHFITEKNPGHHIKVGLCHLGGCIMQFIIKSIKL